MNIYPDARSKVSSLTIAEVCALLNISVAPWARDNQQHWYIEVLGATELTQILGEYYDHLGCYPDMPSSREHLWERLLDEVLAEIYVTA